MKLKVKIILAFLLVSIIPLLITNTLMTISSRSATAEQASNLVKEVSKENIAFIDNYIKGLEKELNIISNNINISSENLDNGKQELHSMAKASGDILSVYAAFSDKKLLIAPMNVPEGFDPTTREWYKNAVNNKGKMVVSDPYIDEISKKLVITVSKQFSTKTGKDAVAGIDLSLDTILGTIEKDSIGKTGYTLIARKDGTIVSHPDNKYVNEGASLKDLGDFGDRLIKNKQGTLEAKDHLGKESVVGHYKSQELGWIAVSFLSKEECMATINKSLVQSIILNIILIGIIILSSFIIITRIMKEVNIIADTLDNIGKGRLDIDVKVNRNDELGYIQRSLKALVGSLTEIVNNIKTSSNGVADSSEELIAISNSSNKSNNEISRVVEEFGIICESNCSSIEEVNASIEEILIGYKDIALNISGAKEDSQRTVSVASEGRDNLEESIKAMNDIEKATYGVGSKVRDMEEYSTKIDFILGTITDISSQTNLLALNAAIEAARAGESGKGFAVVAEEVRKLAEQSSASASEISNIIKNIKNSIEDVAASVESKIILVQNGKSKTESVKESFSDISSSIKRLDDLLESINSKANDQYRSIEEIVVAVDTVSTSVEESVSLTENIKYAKDKQGEDLKNMNLSINKLNNTSSGLNQAVETFKL